MTVTAALSVDPASGEAHLRIMSAEGFTRVDLNACYSAIVSPLSDDESLVGAMRDLVDATFI